MKTNEEERSDFWRNATLLLTGLLVGYIIGRFDLTNVSFKNNATELPVNNVSETTQQNGKEQNSNNVKISVDDDPSVGSDEAPITIIDFSDYQCPFSAKFYNEIFLQMEEEYIKTGKVKYVFRDFPLSIYPKSQYAHYAAECGKEQNKYWEIHGLLFERQKEWSEAENLIDKLTSYAGESGMNTVQFKECLTSEKYREEVEKDKDDGISYGVRGTPTLIINGKIIRGISSYDQFKKLIEKEL